MVIEIGEGTLRDKKLVQILTRSSAGSWEKRGKMDVVSSVGWL
jgi:hypothetical protein